MFHFLFAKTQQSPQVRTIAVPVLLRKFHQVHRNKFLIVAEQVDVAEGAQVIQGPPFLRRKECQVLRAHPGIGNDFFDSVKSAVTENVINRPLNFL